jgi:hypothetical protein
MPRCLFTPPKAVVPRIGIIKIEVMREGIANAMRASRHQEIQANDSAAIYFVIAMNN